MSIVSYEKMNAIQSRIIREQEREINELRESRRILEASNQALAKALSRALKQEGRDRVFIPAGEMRNPFGDSLFRVEETIDGDILLVRA